MLKQRIFTALVLLPVMSGMLFYAPDGLWAAFSGLIALLALWEYARMSGLSKIQINHFIVASLIFGIVAYLGDWKLPNVVWYAVLAFWLLVMPLWLKKKWTLKGGWQAYATGWMLMLPFWYALVDLRSGPESAVSLLAVMGLVWVADIFAYFTGKAFGKNKIAPTISPGKSWEGAVGGMVCVALYMAWVWYANWLAFETTWLNVLLIGFVLTVVSVCGDLLESWLKRAAGIKDSSNLLPGHGGVFDRVDSLIAVLSVYAAMMAILN
ncbi:phosphatidate cytidylyltransferase [Neisseria weixii]|uniref:phosphatidate cytidylyltransferase n=1 Tax=Neisseria weixii TaxID=1853276 RepID=UPI00359FF9C4